MKILCKILSSHNTAASQSQHGQAYTQKYPLLNAGEGKSDIHINVYRKTTSQNGHKKVTLFMLKNNIGEDSTSQRGQETEVTPIQTQQR